MIKRILCMVLLVVVSCQSIEKAPKPDRLIPPDKMINILTDIAFVKGAKGAFKKRLEEKKIDLESYVLQKHEIDSLVFAQNNAWYANDLEQYEEIFSKVKENIKKERTKYQQLKKQEDSIRKREDSIKKAKGIKLSPEKLKLNTQKMLKDDVQKVINPKKKQFKTLKNK